MAAIVDGTVTITRNQSGLIESIRWALKTCPVYGEEPINLTYLRYSHGKNSPQALVMSFGEDEAIMFWAASNEIAEEVHRHLQVNGTVTISIFEPDPEDNEKPIHKQWIKDVAVFHDYMETLAKG
jgi:hypothetical protein